METWGNVLIKSPSPCNTYSMSYPCHYTNLCPRISQKHTHTPLWWWVFCFSSHRDTETPHHTSSPPPPSAIPPSSHQWSPPERAPHHRSRPSSPSETHTHTHTDTHRAQTQSICDAPGEFETEASLTSSMGSRLSSTGGRPDRISSNTCAINTHTHTFTVGNRTDFWEFIDNDN